MNFRSGSHFNNCSGGESRSCSDRIFWCLMYVTHVFKMLRFGSLGIGDVGGEPEWVWACKDLLSAGDIGTVSGGFEALDRVSRILLGLRLLQAYAWIVRCLWTFDVISTPVALRHCCACYMQIVFLLLWNWLQTMWEKLIRPNWIGLDQNQSLYFDQHPCCYRNSRFPTSVAAGQQHLRNITVECVC
jgi:hypothetical protein